MCILKKALWVILRYKVPGKDRCHNSEPGKHFKEGANGARFVSPDLLESNGKID